MVALVCLRQAEPLDTSSTVREVQAMLRARSLAFICLVSIAMSASLVVPPALAESAVLVGAGDIASCRNHNAEATAALLDTIPSTVATFGDNAYPGGSAADFAKCYDPSWGRHKARTRPSLGNHDSREIGAPGYFGYFGALAGEPPYGYYSYELGDWHIVVLNSNCRKISCAAGSEQEQWLRQDLAAHPADCTLAYWHHPRFSSGGAHGSNIQVQDFWKALYEAGADVVINGHDHVYERFVPQDPFGNADTRGIREFVVGTGGSGHDPRGTPIANSEVLSNSDFGVIKMTLHATSYDWEFIPVAGGTFRDAGSASCVIQPAEPPKITALTPTSALVGGAGFTLTIDGLHFAAGAVARWNGADRPTTVVSSTQLLAEVGAADIASTAIVSVTVSNPAPGGESDVWLFPVESTARSTVLLSPVVGPTN
jgi:hypothetical protein